MSEVRLIDAEGLKKALRDAHINMELTFDIATFNRVMNIIDNTPAVEPDEIQAIMKDYLVYRCDPQRPKGKWI